VGSRTLKPKPNEHFFLYQPLKWRGWENHPFTVASWSSTDTESIRTSTPNNAPSTPSLTLGKENEAAVVPVSAPQVVTSDPGTTMTFYIRPSKASNTSFIAQLRSLCSASDQPVPVTILLEGPYGNSSTLHNYDNVLLITGGTGISAALPHLKSHLKSGTIKRTKNLQFVWATK
jgi:hypothetical protein